MSKLDWLSLAERVPLLGKLPQRARAASRTRQLAPLEMLFARGDRPRGMHVVVSGEVRLVRRSAWGSVIILQRASRGFLAEGSLGQTAYHCDAVAATAAEVVTIGESAFKQSLHDASFRHLWMTHLGHELRRVRAQNERLSLRTAEERIIHYIESEGEQDCIMLSQTRKDWAGELGLTHEAIYRALARMSKQGKLTIEGAQICLKV